MRPKGPWSVILRRVALPRIALVCTLAILILMPRVSQALETSLVAPGAPEELQDQLTAASAIMAAEAHGLTTVHELLAASLSDYRTLVQILYGQGYFSPVVHIRLDGREAAYIKPLHPPSQVSKIAVSVDVGKPFRFGRADMSPLAPGADLPQDYATGQPATTEVLQDAVAVGISKWRDAGHAKVAVGDQNIVVKHPEAILDADIRLLPGPKLRFGQMTVSGDTRVNDASLRRIAGFPTGEVYSPQDLQNVATRLRRTGTFSSVSISEADQPNPDGTLDVHATFEDMPPRRLSFGAELSSRNGVDLSFVWMHRNLFGGAEGLRFETRVRNIGGIEDIDGAVAIRLEQPDKLGPDDKLIYLAEIDRRNRTHYNATTGLLGIGVRRVFSDRIFTEVQLGGSYTDADDAFGNGRKFRYVKLPARLEWDRRDIKVNPTRGTFLDARLMPFAGISGTESGAQAIIDGRGYFNLSSSGKFVLAGRLQIGSVLGADLPDVSPEMLFFSGGAGTVRGQPYESLGVPVGARVAGGRAFLGLSAELRTHVTEKLSIVGFFDFGAVDSSSFVDKNSTYHSGAGLGVRYDLGGLGPVRLDLAWPVDGPTGEGMQFYIGIGHAF